MEGCPSCGTRLVGDWVQRTREVREVPVAAVRGIDPQYLARKCPGCGTRQVPAVDLDGVTLSPRHCLGIKLVSQIMTMREEGRLPFATIQWYLATFHRLHVGVGELVGVVHALAHRA